MVFTRQFRDPEDFSFTEFVAATFNRKKCLTEKVGRVIFNSCLAASSCGRAACEMLADFVSLPGFDKNMDGSIQLSNSVAWPC